MREVRAVVVGLLVIVLVAAAIAVWRRPVRELKNIRGYRVEIRKNEGDSSRHISFTVPISVVARMASFAPFSEFGGNLRADWGEGEFTARDILEAARRSSPGQPGVILRNGTKIEVTANGSAIEILAKDDWDKSVKIRAPRAVIESFSNDGRISPREILRRLDDLGPGEVVAIRDGDEEVTITAEAKE